jgi:hypothetical protein
LSMISSCCGYGCCPPDENAPAWWWYGEMGRASLSGRREREREGGGQHGGTHSDRVADACDCLLAGMGARLLCALESRLVGGLCRVLCAVRCVMVAEYDGLVW